MSRPAASSARRADGTMSWGGVTEHGPEQAGAAEARRHVEEFSSGAAHARLTQEAKHALFRVNRGRRK